MPPELLPSNAISSLIIHGLVKNKDSDVPLTLLKACSVPSELFFTTRPAVCRPDGPPNRLPSQLPPSGNLCLRASLQGRLGLGRIGSVYPLNLSESTHSLLKSQHSGLPPLVVKVAGSRWSEKLAREAWFYEEMENLQGVSIARCYGIFQATLPEGCSILSWADHDESEETIVEVIWPDSDEDPTSTPQVVYAPKPLRNSVSILLLEGLGGHMPVGVSTESFEADVYEIYNDIGRLGIEHVDSRWRNVLKAPETSNSLICPHHGHPHEWRLVDFECSRKTNQLPHFLDKFHKSWMSIVFSNLPKGRIIDGELDD